MEPFDDLQADGRVSCCAPLAVAAPSDNGVRACELLEAGPRTRFNRRFFWLSATLLLLVSLGLPIQHDRQMRRLSLMLYKRAQSQEATGDVQATIAAWYQYLAFNPGDYRALASLSESLAKVAQTPTENFELFRLYERVLQGDPGNAECRRKVIDLLIRGGHPSAARSHIDILLESEPRNPALFRDRGICWIEEAELEEAARDLLTASRLAPKDFRLHRQLTSLLADRLNRAAEAEQFMNDVLEQNGFSSEAYLSRAEFFDSIGRGDKAAKDVDIAYQLAPSSPAAQLAMARLKVRQGAAARTSSDVDLNRLRRELASELERMKSGSQPRPTSYTAADVAEAVALLDVHQNRLTDARAMLEQGLLDQPENVNLMTLVAELHLASDNVAAATEELEKLRARKAPPPVLRFLEARIAMLRRDWPVAIRELELLSNTTHRVPYLESQIQRLLGDAYARLGDQAASKIAYRRATTADPASLDAARRLAEFLAASGQIEAALEEYGRFAGLPEVDLQRARLMLKLNLERTPAERDWDSITEILEAESQRDPANVDLQLFRAEVLEAQGNSPGAEALLREIKQRNPMSAIAHVALANWFLRTEHPEEALAILIDARQRLGNDRQIVEALARALQFSRTEEFSAELKSLWREFLPLEGADNAAVRRVLAGVILRMGSFADRQGLIDEIRTHQRDDLELWILMGEWAARQGEREQVQAVIGELRRLEGESGANWKLCEAEFCVVECQRGRQSELRRAATLLDEASGKLTGSARLALAQAEVAALSGNLPSAIRSYRLAVDLGERRPDVLRRCIGMMLAANQDAEASRLLDQYRRTAGERLANELRDLDVLIAFRTQPAEAAIQRASANAAASSAGVEDVLLLGQVQAGAGKLVEAEASFRRGIELDPGRADAWIGLVVVLASQQRTSEAAEVLEEARHQIAAEQRVAALATGYEIAGRPDRSKAIYSEALRTHPDDVELTWGLAGLSLRQGSFREAEQILDEVLRRAPEQRPELVRPARRILAALLHQRGDYESYQRGISLIDLNLADGEEPSDLRLKARFFAAHPSETKRRQAISLLLDVERRVAALDADDQRRLVELYLSVGDWVRGRERLVLLVAAEMNAPDVLAYGCGLLLSHNEPPGHWFDVLAQAEPDSPRTIQLVAWDLLRQGHVDDALELIQGRLTEEEAASAGAASDADGDAGPAHWAARVCVELGGHFETAGERAVADRLYHEAERLYRDLLVRRPVYRLSLAELLGRMGRLDEALDECDSSRSEFDLATIGQVAVSLLRNDRSALSLQRHQRVRRWLEAAIASNPDMPELTFQLATLTHRAGDYPAAIRYYRLALNSRPGALAVLNELALLVSMFERNHREALQLIDEAMARSGPLPMLRDTRGIILLASGSTDAALAELSAAVAEQPSAAKYFHLAQARFAVGDRAGGAEAFQHALDSGLTPAVLHPLEMAEFQRLSAEHR